MAAFHLVADGVHYIAEVELSGFFGNTTVEHDLQQQVAQFVFQIVDVITRDRVGDFIRFFDRVWRDRREALRAVPFATVHRVAQAGHDGDDPGGHILHNISPIINIM